MPKVDRNAAQAVAQAKRRNAEATREKILGAALQCFSTQGFDASSTRQIEELAGVNRSLITYHFGTKQALWKETVRRLMRAVQKDLQIALDGMVNVDGAGRFRYFVRAFVRVCAKYPELYRLMIHEGMQDDERLRWLVDRSVRPWFETIGSLLDEAQALGYAPPMSHLTFYYILTGGAAIMFSNAAEARLLSGHDPMSQSEISTHADALANLLFPEREQT